MAISPKKGSCLGKGGKFPFCEADDVYIVTSRQQCISCSNKMKLQNKKSSGKRTTIRKFSTKQEKLNTVYNVAAAQFKKDNPLCQLRIKEVCTIHTQDVHHTNGRGLNLLSVPTWKSGCRSCHDWVHLHPKESRELGLLV